MKSWYTFAVCASLALVQTSATPLSSELLHEPAAQPLAPSHSDDTSTTCTYFTSYQLITIFELIAEKIETIGADVWPGSEEEQRLHALRDNFCALLSELSVESDPESTDDGADRRCVLSLHNENGLHIEGDWNFSIDVEGDKEVIDQAFDTLTNLIGLEAECRKIRQNLEQLKAIALGFGAGLTIVALGVAAWKYTPSGSM